jgi:hypothetical protein
MLAFWASRPRIRPALVAFGAFAIAIAVLALVGAHGAAAASHRDSSRTVNRIVIDEQGVQIDGGRAGDTASGNDDDRNLTIHVGPKSRGRVTIGPNGILVDGDKANVHRIGPTVTVDGDDNDVVRVFADAEVDRGERIEGDVVAVFGSVTIHGEVTGSTVAVFGRVVLDSTAHVEGDAVAVGGALEAAPGSVVNGQSVSLDFLPFSWGVPGLPFMIGALLVMVLASLFIGWLMQLLFADRLMRAAVTASRRTGMSFFLGLVSAPLMVIAGVLLLITVIGIPLALLLPIAYLLLTCAGQLAGSYVLGSKLMRRPLGQPWSFAPLAAGILFVGAFFMAGALLSSSGGVARSAALFFDLLGLLLVMGLTVIGTGAILLSRLGGRPAEVRAHPESVIAPPPAPPASAPPSPAPVG